MYSKLESAGFVHFSLMLPGSESLVTAEEEMVMGVPSYPLTSILVNSSPQEAMNAIDANAKVKNFICFIVCFVLIVMPSIPS